MSKTIEFQRTGHDGGAYLDKFTTGEGQTLGLDTNGDAASFSPGDADLNRQRGGLNRLTSFTDFEFLPAASLAFGKDPYFIEAGTGTEVITRATKGGVNLKSQASTPANDDNVYIAGNASGHPFLATAITATNLIVLTTRVAINTITAMFASIGLNENLTDVDPTGTAGEGAMFVFDPTGEFVSGGSANWHLAHKVDGTDTFTDTGIPVVASQGYELRIEIGTDRKAKFYIDGAYVGTGPALTASDSVGVFAGLELTATPGGQKDMDIRYIALSRAIA